MFSAKRRFIAGAVCPRCSEMDKIAVYREEDKDYRECVACDFKEEMRFQPERRELDTRVNRTQEEKQSETQVVQLQNVTPKTQGTALPGVKVDSGFGKG